MPIRWRLTLFNALVIGAILLALALSLFLLLRDALLSNVEGTVRSQAVAAAKALESGNALLGDDAKPLTTDEVFLIVRDARGEILDQTPNLSVSEGARDPVWRRALASGDSEDGTAKLFPRSRTTSTPCP